MVNLRFNKEALRLRSNIKKRNQQKLMRHKKVCDKTYSSIIIHGGRPIQGELKISGAKNAALPLIFASILTKETVTLNNVPNLSDIHTAVAILQQLGITVNFTNNTLTINASNIKQVQVNPDLVSSMRASVLILGPLLSRIGIAEMALPGGCTIGKRPIDIHLNCLHQMGADITDNSHSIYLQTRSKLTGHNIYIDKASVGATETILMAATLASGTTVINNAAQEPEIVDLANMLNTMGALITGQGTSTISVQGVEELHGTNYTVCPDRIEAGSYLMAAAVTKGSLILHDINWNHLTNIINPLQEIGCTIEKLSETSLSIISPKQLFAKDITTQPYPYFSTDLQPQWTTLMCLAKGSCTINETIFENRLGHTQELKKMGANISVTDNNHIFTVTGVKSLYGATVVPSDLRSSFALIMAGLAAKGITTIYNLTFLDRGYENAILKLQQCGASIERIDAEAKNCEITSKLKCLPVT